MPLTCTGRSSGLGEGFPGATSEISLLWAKHPPPPQSRLKGAVCFQLRGPQFCERLRATGQKCPRGQDPRLLEKLRLPPPPPPAVHQGRAGGNLPAQGQGKGVKMAHQGSFPPRDSLHPSPELYDSLLAALSPCSHLPLVDSPRFHQSVVFLKCNSDHVTFLLKILHQVPTAFRIEILTTLHGIQAESCIGSLATSPPCPPPPTPSTQPL